HRRKNSSQARIFRQGANEGIGLTDPVRQSRNFVHRQKQQTILLKKSAAAGMADGEKSVGMCQKRPGEFSRRLLGKLWRGSIDDDNDAKLGERLHVLQRTLCPRQIRRYELVYVGLDREAFPRIDGARGREREGQSQRPQWTLGAITNNC